VGLFRRSQPLHRRLAEAGGLDLGAGGERSAAPPAPPAEPPGWDGEPRGEPGIHGVPRARRWDAVTTVEAPGLVGDRIGFVALDGQELLVEEDEPEDALQPLAEAVEARLQPPYRAEATRQAGDRWAVGAKRIAVVSAPGLHGDQAELVSTRDGRELRVDGRPSFRSAPTLEQVGERVGSEYVVRGSRLDGDRWEVEASPL